MKVLFSNKSTLVHECRKHSHECYEIVITVSGTGITHANGHEFNVKQGSIVILPPGTVHSHRSDTGFSDIFVQTDTLGINLKSAVAYLDNTDTAVVIANMIYINFLQKEFNYENITQKLLEILIEYIIRLRGKSYRYDFVQKFKDIMTENFSNSSFEIPVEAEKLGVSFDYMRHCFKSEMNITPLEYLTQLRIEQAKNHLSNSDVYSVGEIAEMCGFSDQYYFSRLFKKIVGLSPREYRNKHNIH